MIHVDHSIADTYRSIAIFTTVLAVACFPAAVRRQGRQWSAWAAVLASEFFMASAIASVGAHWHEANLVWYRVPLMIVGSALMIAFAIQVFTTPPESNRHGGRHP